MSANLASTLRSLNLEFQGFVDAISRNTDNQIEAREAMSLLGQIDRGLARVSKCLEGVPKAALGAPDIALQIEAYRQKLEALKSNMRALEFRLGEQKAGLESIQGKMSAASAWAASMREIS